MVIRHSIGTECAHDCHHDVPEPPYLVLATASCGRPGKAGLLLGRNINVRGWSPLIQLKGVSSC